MNTVNLTGRLTHTPEVRVTSTNKHVLDFSIAVRETAEVTNFIRCQAWEKTADIIADYATKGSNLAIAGSLKVDKYPNKDGNTVEKVFVRVNTVEVLDRRKDSLDKKTAETGFAPNKFGSGIDGIEPNDLPFY